MIWRFLVHQFRIPASVFSPALLLIGSLPPQVPILPNPPMQVSLEFPPSPGGSGPGSTAGGGVRGASCSNRTLAPLTAVIPKNQVGLTVSPNPTVLAYIPPTQATQAEFVVFDDQSGDEIYAVKVALSGVPGMAPFRLPETVNLEIGKLYIWQVSLICDPKDRSSDETVQGSIQRLALSQDLQTQLQGATTALDKAKVYAKERLWYETLATLAELRSANEAEWKQFLESVGLKAIASAPIINCCTPTEHPK